MKTNKDQWKAIKLDRQIREESEAEEVKFLYYVVGLTETQIRKKFNKSNTWVRNILKQNQAKPVSKADVMPDEQSAEADQDLMKIFEEAKNGK